VALGGGCGQFGLDPLFDERGNQAGERAAKLRDFADKLRAQVAVGFTREHKDGFEARLEFAVHQRHLEFVFVIGDGSDAAEDYGGVALAGVVDEQALEDVDFDARELPGDFAQHFDTLGDREERLFVHVLEYRDDDAIEHFFAAADQVEMPVGDGIEGAGIDGNGSFHEGCTLPRHILTRISEEEQFFRAAGCASRELAERELSQQESCDTLTAVRPDVMPH